MDISAQKECNSTNLSDQYLRVKEEVLSPEEKKVYKLPKDCEDSEFLRFLGKENDDIKELLSIEYWKMIGDLTDKISYKFIIFLTGSLFKCLNYEKGKPIDSESNLVNEIFGKSPYCIEDENGEYAIEISSITFSSDNGKYMINITVKNAGEKKITVRRETPV